MTQPIRSRQRRSSTPWWQKRALKITIALLGLLLIIVVITINVAKYETHLATGDTVLLELAPVDPRGFMQGDYMMLSYALEREVFHALPPDSNTKEAIEQASEQLLQLDNTTSDAEADILQLEANSVAVEPSEYESETAEFAAMQAEAMAEAESNELELDFRKYDPREGYVIVKVDDNNVGQFVRLADSNNHDGLAKNEMAIHYRARNGSAKIATNAYFFQEGHAEAFEAAEYGLFRVNDKGEPLLTEMVDGNFRVIKAASNKADKVTD